MLSGLSPDNPSRTSRNPDRWYYKCAKEDCFVWIWKDLIDEYFEKRKQWDKEIEEILECEEILDLEEMMGIKITLEDHKNPDVEDFCAGTP